MSTESTNPRPRTAATAAPLSAGGTSPQDRTETVELGGSRASSSGLSLRAGTVLAERYELSSRLGTGGYAAVYQAWDRELRRLVAIKVLRPDRVSEKALRRFRREARVAQELSSHRLVRVYDLGRTDELVYMTMELVRGESLASRISRCGALGIEESLRIVRQVLEGLDVLHRRGVVHRDIKPSNILLDENDDVRLADFGLVLPLQTDETRATAADTVIGTVEYLSPESALGQDASAQSDLYSVGVVLFEMLTGRVPHRAGSSLGTLVRSLTRPPADVRELRADVPRWLGLFIGKLLEREPAHRYTTAEGALADLERRRAPLSRQLRALQQPLLLVVASLAIAVLMALAFRQASTDSGEISHLAQLEGGGIRAVAKDGEELWRSTEVPSRAAALARLEPDGPIRIVAVLQDPRDPVPERSRVLSVLDPRDGAILRTVELPSAAPRFSGFADRYTARVVAEDLDDDGVDEILVTYLHQPYWPSFTVLWEPSLQRTRLAFVASGHHYFSEAADLDGDGQRELLMVGINNRMGWMHAVAAVRLLPAAGVLSADGARGLASSPDRTDDRSWALLHWYALVGRVLCSPLAECLEVDESRRTISFNNPEGWPTLDFDGFVLGATDAALSTSRSELRKRAYELLRDTERLRGLSMLEEALAQAVEALEAARGSGDDFLIEWIARTRARILASSGRSEEAARRFATLIDESFDPSEVAFEAARSFHLAGELERSVEWYRRANATTPGDRWGRSRIELLEGIVLALAEQRSWQEALLEIERYERSYSHSHGGLDLLADYYRQYVLWRRGEVPDPTLAPHNTDLPRYWSLEFRLANGEEPSRLLTDVEAELEVASETVPLLSALRAELLDRLGRTEEARQLASFALESAIPKAESEPVIRAHLNLVRDRASAER